MIFLLNFQSQKKNRDERAVIKNLEIILDALLGSVYWSVTGETEEVTW